MESPKPLFRRYVAIGDSSTEGLDDPDGRGGYRGWADRLAARVAASNPGLLYANFGVRGRKTGEILATQLAPALALRPDLMTLFSGTNDVVARSFDIGDVARAIESMQRAIRATGATLLTFTLPDLEPVLPAARRLAPRIAALNAALRESSLETGTILVDLALHPVAVDPRLWSDDRIHANSAGHARIAAALAHALGLPGADESWREPLPPAAAPGRWARMSAELRWTSLHLAPWMLRHLAGRSSGDGRAPKRPELGPVQPGSS
jgi:lysophospholipase L1-like esterase